MKENVSGCFFLNTVYMYINDVKKIYGQTISEGTFERIK